jgi:sec-independent protein translocase protein TatA
VTVGPFQILIIALVILVLFGRGRISGIMGDFGKGVKSFRRHLDDETARPAPVANLEGAPDTSEAAAEPVPARDPNHN